MVDAILRSNVVSIRTVRTLAGKALHFASQVVFVETFLSDLWGPLQETDNFQKPAHHGDHVGEANQASADVVQSISETPQKVRADDLLSTSLQ